MSDKPDITHAQVAAPITSLVAVIGVVQTAPERLQLPLIIIVGVNAAVWLLADAFLRGKRNESAAAVVNQVTEQIRSFPREGNDAIVPAVPTSVTAAKVQPQPPVA